MPKKILVFLVVLALLPINSLTGRGASSWIYPETLLVSTNLTGDVTYLQDHVTNPDENWLKATSASAGTKLEVRLQSQPSLLKVGAGLQSVQVLVRKNATGGNNPTVRADLYQNLAGVKTQIATTSQTVGDVNVLLTLSFDAAILPNRNGESMEVVITGTPANSGGPQTKRTVEVGAISFDPIFDKPPAPTNFKLLDLSTHEASLSWDADSSVEHYELMQNGIKVYDGRENAYNTSNLVTSTDYTYALRSFNGVDYSDPVVLEIKTMSTNDWKKVSASANSFALTYGGNLWGSGANNFIQLGSDQWGLGQVSPVLIGAKGEWEDVSSAANHTLARKKDGSLWAWGNNAQGQLGLGNTTRAFTMTQVGTANDWKHLDTGSRYTVAIKTNGTLWAWGNGSRFGDQSLLSPKQIGTGSDWDEISVASHVLALKEDGSLWAWGENESSQLGLGAASSLHTEPVRVGTEVDWKKISSGEEFSLAIKQDGTLWAWGKNLNGQLGLGDSVTRFVPTQVGAENNWKEISAGTSHSLAIKSDGTLWAWGLNTNGQLGLGDTLQRTVPTKVGNETSWKDISAGVSHSLAIKYNGTLWAWGLNTNGRLGLGDTVQRTVPTQVIADTIPPSEVSEVAYRYTANGVELAWKNPSDADFEVVRIYRNETLITSTANELFLDDWLGAVSGNQTYRLATVDSNGNESSGMILEIAAKMAAPKSFRMFDRWATAIHLTWADVIGAVAYELYRNGEKVYEGTEKSFTDMNLTSNTFYSYQLIGKSEISQTDPAKVEVYTSLDTPQLEAENIQSNEVTLNWSPVEGATHYELTREGETIYFGNDLSFTDYQVQEDTQYTYEVVATNKNTLSKGVEISIKTPQEGYLSFTPPAILSDFEPITIDGTTQTRTATLGKMTIKDTRSQQSPWTLSVVATPFTEKGAGETAKTLTTETFALAGIASVTEKNGTFNTLQTLLSESDTSSITGTALEILKAPNGGSAGEFEVLFPTPTLELKIQTASIMAPSLPITYESTLIWTINVGP